MFNSFIFFVFVFSYLKAELNIEHNNINFFWHNLHSNNNSYIADLDRNSLVSSLELSPKVEDRVPSNVIVEIPCYNGHKKAFRFFETSVLPLSLKKKYPKIKSFTGIGIQNPSHRSSIVLFEKGLFGFIIDENGNSHIKVDENYKAIISRSKIPYQSPLDNNCEINIQNNNFRDFNDDIFWDCVGTDNPCYPVGSALTTYRFAGIMSERVTNEVSDGTVEGGLAWMVAMVNQINLLWIRELSFKLEMVQESDQLIFTDNNPAPDVFQQDPSCHSSGDPKYCELEEVKPYLESIIGPGGDDTPQNERTWEYGAHFDTRYNGGVAYMPGSTSTNNPNYEVFNHELGHNLGSAHNISIEGGWRCTIGGTIMGSRVRTLDIFSGDQYSSHTIELAMNYRNDPMIYQDIGIWGGDYVLGFNSEYTDNIIPDLDVPESGFIIPKETPFILEGMSIPYNPNYTFAWEQNDASDESFSMNPSDNSLPFFLPNKGPLFSTVDPTLLGFKRYFPSIQSLLNNNYSTEIDDYGNMLTVEKLPFASRELNMRLIVRTNDPYAGSLNHKNVKFLVAGTAGPFRITSQIDSTIWEVGSQQEITWDVANTDDPDSVNCQTLDLIMSINNGEPFDFVLAEGIPNNGSFILNVPPTPPTESARLMLRADSNIFFDINNGYITIQNNNIPSLEILESSIEIQLNEDSNETFSSEVTNEGEEGSVVSFITYPGKQLISQYDFSYGILPEDWSDSTNAECENPGWFISEDASSSYFTIPTFDGYYIAVNDDACGSESDGSNDMLYTGPVSLSEDLFELSFDRFFTGGFGQTFHVYISTDNWNNSQEIFSLGYWDGNEEWVNEDIPLNDFSGETVEFAFHSNDNGNWASGIALDNISISLTPSWVTSSSSGIINFQEVESFNFNINTQELSNGIYHGDVVIEDSNQNLSDTLHITLSVGENVSVDDNILPQKYILEQNFPNPFNPSTKIKFSIPRSENVELIIYDILGNEIKKIVDRELKAGLHKYKWSGNNNSGDKIGSGVYFYKIRAGSFIKTKKMIFLK